jgi:hypothetical protein
VVGKWHVVVNRHFEEIEETDLEEWFQYPAHRETLQYQLDFLPRKHYIEWEHFSRQVGGVPN